MRLKKNQYIENKRMIGDSRIVQVSTTCRLASMKNDTNSNTKPQITQRIIDTAPSASASIFTTRTSIFSLSFPIYLSRNYYILRTKNNILICNYYALHSKNHISLLKNSILLFNYFNLLTEKHILICNYYI